VDGQDSPTGIGARAKNVVEDVELRVPGFSESGTAIQPDFTDVVGNGQEAVEHRQLVGSMSCQFGVEPYSRANRRSVVCERRGTLECRWGGGDGQNRDGTILYFCGDRRWIRVEIQMTVEVDHHVAL
jgi:hypothetical protein